MPSGINDSSSSTGNPILDAIAARPMAIVTAVIGLLVIAAGVVAVINQRAAKAQAANNALFAAEKNLDTETKAWAAAVAPATPPAGAAQPGSQAAKPEQNPEAVEYKKADVDAKFPEAIKGFKAVMEKFQGTRAAFEAGLSLGSLYLDHGEPSKALPWYQQAVSQAPRSFDQAVALSSLGYAQEGSGKYSDAVESFKKALSLTASRAPSQNQAQPQGESSDGEMKGEIWLSIARNQALGGDKAQAKATYEQIIKEMPNSEPAQTAELLKSQLDSKERVGEPATPAA